MKKNRYLLYIFLAFFFSFFSFTETNAEIIYIQPDNDITATTTISTTLAGSLWRSDSWIGVASTTIQGGTLNFYSTVPNGIEYIGCIYNLTDATPIGCTETLIGTGNLEYYLENIGLPDNQNGAIIAGKTYEVVFIKVTAGTANVSFPADTSNNIQIIVADNGGTELNLDNNETRIIDFTPNEGDYFGNPASTTAEVPFTLTAWINEADIGTVMGVEFTLRNIDQNHLIDIPFFDDTDDITFLDSYHVTEAGLFEYASTTTLNTGNYRVEARLVRSYFGGWFENPFSEISDEQTHQFTVNEGTFLGGISQNGISMIGELFDGYTASTSGEFANLCNPLGGDVSTYFLNEDFSTIGCITFLLIPDGAYLRTSIGGFYDNIKTHFPIGYINDFLQIIATTSSSSLPILSATVPNGIVGSGATIEFDPTNAIDYILNAKVDDYNSSDVSTTTTFYEYTSFYWDMIVYILVAFYILRRILSSHVIPHSFHKK